MTTLEHHVPYDRPKLSKVRISIHESRICAYENIESIYIPSNNTQVIKFVLWPVLQLFKLTSYFYY